MSQGVPVVVSRTKIDSFYFDDSLVRFFPAGDDGAMTDAMIEVMENSTLRESLIAKAQEYADRNSWDRKKQEYMDLVDRLSTEGLDLVCERPVVGVDGQTVL
jgi:glycosyltransferase involved in cell wall biosynthesis